MTVKIFPLRNEYRITLYIIIECDSIFTSVFPKLNNKDYVVIYKLPMCALQRITITC